MERGWEIERGSFKMAKKRGLMDAALESSRKRYVVETRRVTYPDGQARPFPVKVYPITDARLARFDKKD